MFITDSLCTIGEVYKHNIKLGGLVFNKGMDDSNDVNATCEYNLVSILV